jgi:hypothetical protein
MNGERPREPALPAHHEVRLDAHRDAEARQIRALLPELHRWSDLGVPLALLQDNAGRVQREHVPRTARAGDAHRKERRSRDESGRARTRSYGRGCMKSWSCVHAKGASDQWHALWYASQCVAVSAMLTACGQTTPLSADGNSASGPRTMSTCNGSGMVCYGERVRRMFLAENHEKGYGEVHATSTNPRD